MNYDARSTTHQIYLPYFIINGNLHLSLICYNNLSILFSINILFVGRVQINSRRKSFDQVATLRDVHSIKTMKELSFDLEETTYSAVRPELRS